MMRQAASRAQNYAVDDVSSDSDLNDMATTKSEPPNSNMNDTAKEGAKKRGRPKASADANISSAGNPKTKVQRTNDSEDGKKPKATRRRAQKEVPSTQVVDGADELDDFDQEGPAAPRALSEPMSATKQRTDASAATAAAPPSTTASETTSKAKTRKGRATKKAAEQIPETQVDGPDVHQASSHFGRTRPSNRPPKPATRSVVQETQIDTMDVDADTLEETEEAPKTKRGRRKPEPKPKPQPDKTNTKDIVSDQEQAVSDLALRRQLSDMNKKFEALELKYENLKGVGVHEAQTNFDELKKRTDERAKASDTLISNLRTELAAQSAKASESDPLHSQISDLNAQAEKLRKEKKLSEASLASAQSEVRTLQAKLAATRTASEQRTVPGSAVKAGTSGQLPAVAENAQKRGGLANGARNGALPGQLQQLTESAQKRLLKEDLYGDLTGLIIRDVKRRDEDSMDVYDCIQTGKNGTLHFHLALPNPAPAGVSYGDAEFEYTPLLDASHDRSLIDVLPDYLTEEIIFPQREAQRFYSRINEFIMKSRRPPPQADDEQDDNDGDGDAEGGEDEIA